MPWVPEIITHNYDPERGRFRNICALPDAEAEQILCEIRASGKGNINPDYLPRRRAAEAWLLSERRSKLGAPYLAHPVYFFLGDFADGQDPSRPRSIVMPLAALSPETVTFTYPDSMASLPIATCDSRVAHRKSYHGQVFTLDEIAAVIAEFGLPGTRWRTEPSMKHDKFIEVQVWDDRPIRHYVKRASHGHLTRVGLDTPSPPPIC